MKVGLVYNVRHIAKVKVIFLNSDIIDSLIQLRSKIKLIFIVSDVLVNVLLSH